MSRIRQKTSNVSDKGIQTALKHSPKFFAKNLIKDNYSRIPNNRTGSFNRTKGELYCIEKMYRLDYAVKINYRAGYINHIYNHIYGDLVSQKTQKVLQHKFSFTSMQHPVKLNLNVFV